ncbi:hypothetical protein GCM10023216_26810 [Isoptericola chiayiensis]|uniref:Uncharacterized protein n=1 Tax=Isoptericola chiayiensis TaxID=579446 RepID=A0ABP8YR86_9MICO|nr:hypothetical protein [Isoptericola chiayiensis]
MPVRAVVLPATVLLVPTTGARTGPADAVRTVVLAALRAVDAGAGWGVLGPAPDRSRRDGRPNLAGAGIADRWVPLLADDAWSAPGGPAAGTAVSVAALLLAEAHGARTAAAAGTVELADDDQEALERAVADLAGRGAIVVAGGVPGDPHAGDACTPAVSAVVRELAARGGWRSRTEDVEAHGDHLPGRYTITVWDG